MFNSGRRGDLSGIAICEQDAEAFDAEPAGRIIGRGVGDLPDVYLPIKRREQRIQFAGFDRLAAIERALEVASVVGC
ncbi:MAG: hypothetical protein QM775_03105 [Pirellulales bacterium]